MSTPVKGRHASEVAARKTLSYRVGAVVVLACLVAAGALAYASVRGNDEDPPAESVAEDAAFVVPVSAAPEVAVDAIHADPAPADPGPLSLNGPTDVRPGTLATFMVRWTTQDDEPVDGVVDLQHVSGNTWATVEQVDVSGGEGSVDVKVDAPTIFRLAYGGSDELDEAHSPAHVVTTGRPLASRITATAESDDAGAVKVTAAWTTDGGVPIVGRLELQRETDDGWRPASAVTTGEDGIAAAQVQAHQRTKFRFVYSGGVRFGPVTSDEAVSSGGEVRTIPVATCSTIGGIDALGRGQACHWTPVTVGAFVVGHDYLGNAWWNTAPMGSLIELTGERAGLYEVVDRVIAPARGAALGSASDWWCGDSCDVVLQTCQGQNTGFTWLRRVEEPLEPAA